ncbi:MAG: ribonuclease HII [Gemmatimonadaceae bacterium]
MAGSRRREPRYARWSGIERELRRTGVLLIAGVDEVGRGSLAGPVVASAVIMPPGVPALRGVDDSKRLTRREREKLCIRIRERALALAVGAASVREIDTLNIFNASVLAMRRALLRLALQPDHVLVDGRRLRSLGVAHTGVIDGDAKCFNVACASIVAKVTRDRLMARLAPRYPDFGWASNCGYGTPDHVRGLTSRGPSVHHRRAFVAAVAARLRAGASLEEAGDIVVPASVSESTFAPTHVPAESVLCDSSVALDER